MIKVYAVQTFFPDFNGVCTRGPFVNFRLYSTRRKARAVMKTMREKAKASGNAVKYEIESYYVE